MVSGRRILSARKYLAVASVTRRRGERPRIRPREASPFQIFHHNTPDKPVVARKSRRTAEREVAVPETRAEETPARYQGLCTPCPREQWASVVGGLQWATRDVQRSF